MRYLSRVSAVFGLFLSLAPLACTQQPSDAHPQTFPKVTIAGSEVRTLKSTSTGRNYDLYIHIPSTYDQDKSKRYPVLYILDGQWDFKLMDSVLGGLVYERFVPEMIMVGITYSGEHADYSSLRAMDDTPTATLQVKGSGDAPKFLKFIQTELIPFVETNYRADPAHRVLQGSSYAGLFTLYALFSDPGLFSAYIVASPDVRYGDGYVFKQEAEYARTHKGLPVKLYLAVGEAEELNAPVQKFIKVLESRGYQALKLKTRVIEGERHASNKPELFNRGLRFVFSE